MIKNHNGAGSVRVRVLKLSNARHRNEYYDEWRLIEDNDPNPEFYIAVEDGDLYAIEITYLQGFDMGPLSHARSKFHQVGHRCAVKMQTYHHPLHRDDDEAADEQLLTRDIVHTFYQKEEGKVDGVDMRDLKFAVKGLMPGMYLWSEGKCLLIFSIQDPELTERHVYGYGASAEDLSRIAIEVFCFKETREDISEEEAVRRYEKNRKRHDREHRYVVHADDWISHDTVDEKSYNTKGVTHTHTGSFYLFLEQFSSVDQF